MRRAPILWTACVCLLLVRATLAEVGRLTPCTLGPDERIVRLVKKNVRVRDDDEFFKPAEGSGCVSPKAMGVNVDLGGGVVAVAIDTKKADDRLPNVARIDLTGKGDFTNAIAVDLTAKVSHGSLRTRIGPVTVPVDIAGVKQAVRFDGRYYKWQGGQRTFWLDITTVRQGQCKFGDKVYPLRITDGNGNLTVNDKMVLKEKFGRRIDPSGDTILLGNEDGMFSHENPKAMVGAPIQVDGVWYDVTVSDDQTQVKAEPVKAEFGTLRFGHESSWVRLIGNGKLLVFNLGREGVPVPAGTYEVVRYGEDKGEAIRVSVIAAVEKATLPVMITVKAGETVDATVGTPLVTRPRITRRGRRVEVAPQQFDSAGLAVKVLGVGPVGRQRGPETPKVKVYDEAGTLIHQGAFEYG